jgi:hypothetical protein
MLARDGLLAHIPAESSAANTAIASHGSVGRPSSWPPAPSSWPCDSTAPCQRQRGAFSNACCSRKSSIPIAPESFCGSGFHEGQVPLNRSRMQTRAAKEKPNCHSGLWPSTPVKDPLKAAKTLFSRARAAARRRSAKKRRPRKQHVRGRDKRYRSSSGAQTAGRFLVATR